MTTLIQTGTGNNTAVSSLTVTQAATTATNSLLIFIAVSSSTGITLTPSDTAGNTWNTLVSGTNTVQMQCWYAINKKAQASNGVKVTLSTGVGNVAAIVREYRGVSPAGLDTNTSSGATGTSAAPTSASISTAKTNSLLIGIAANASGTATVTAGTGFGNAIASTDSSDVTVALEDMTVGSIGSYTAAFTMTSSAWVAGIAAFKVLPFASTTGLRPHIFSPGLAR